MNARRSWLIAVTLALAATGCISADQAAPTCDDAGRNTLVLMAQSVPGAQYVPCIEALPAGWSIDELEIKSTGTQLRVTSSTTTAPSAIAMTFEDSCEVDEAVEVPSDEDHARRYEMVEDIENGYRGTSYYVFDGGCLRLGFDVQGDGWSATVNDASAALTLESRSALERYLQRYSNGVIEHL